VLQEQQYQPVSWTVHSQMWKREKSRDAYCYASQFFEMRTGTQLDFREAYWYAAQFLATMRTGTHLNFYWTYFGSSRLPDY